MADRMSTATRMDRARDNAAISRAVNGALKRKERASRDKRMTAIVKKGSLPYIPSVMSWLSVKLDKPSTQITQDEVNNLVK
ncbi:hypothetical protein [Limnoglobus roseus]|uniref:Uncharacterized protein n=1 Tax=Limnoglobus roseus TaxID=2598579 RepID=A0A5C1AI21_9BACT|nr:hypothetical protein [Limnoglobus roseus]QEL18831.1 hypothetical protein PX52LOC_05871 [Limnoglobus roseus]